MKSSNHSDFSDVEIIAMMSQSDGRRNEAISYVYKWEDLKEKVNSFVRQRGGSSQDGLDIFHEGIIAFDRNIRMGRFRSESSLQGYLFSICRFIWNNEWRRKNKFQSFTAKESPTMVVAENPEITLFNKEKKENLRNILRLLDHSCRKILMLWQRSFSMEEIAIALKLSSAQMAKKYRYRCMKKLMKSLDEKPELLKALKDE